MMQRADITAAALALVGTPFHASQRAPGLGLDCIGVVACVARACGIQVEDRIAYPLTPNGELEGELNARLVRVDGMAQEGDILMMQMDRMHAPHHVAILISENRIVHAHSRAGKCVVQTYSRFWQQAVRGVYRYPGVE